MSLEEIDKNSLLNITISGTYAWEPILKQIPAITGLTVFKLLIFSFNI